VPSLTVNGQTYEIQADAATPLLWLIRDVIGLKGTKYGCGIGVCGACTVLVGSTPTLTCQIVIDDINGAPVTTIEGLSGDGSNPLQMAWIAQQVPQCGYCQSGQIMRATQLIANGQIPTDEQIDTTMNNICVCGTYTRIRAAIHEAAGG
jgi:aerobic-type carbon monoxide dehydrogenase small subunit (CoxS/CutS family)